MIKSKKTGILAAVGLVASGIGIVACSDPGSTSIRDFLSAQGVVFLADGKTAVANLPISAYDWIVSFTDGSTVSVPATPSAGITTSATGAFNINSDQLYLQSGNQEQSCTEVCVATATAEQDDCVDYQTDYQDYCANWSSGGQTCTPCSTGSTGGGSFGSTGGGSTGGGSTGGGSSGGGECCTDNQSVCTDWETEATSYCDQWVATYYDYCTTYAQDCGLIYPSRDITDIKEAYSEITYNANGSIVTTASNARTKAAVGSSHKSTTDANGNTVDAETWTQADEYTSVFSSQQQVLASITASVSATELASRAQVTASHNASKHPRTYRTAGLPKLGRTHAACVRVPSDRLDSLNAAQKLKLESTRTAFGAYPANSTAAH